DAGGAGAEAREIVGRRKELILLQPRLEAVRLRPQEVQAGFQIVLAEELVDGAGERPIALIEIGRRSDVAEDHGRKIAEDATGREAAPRVVGIEGRRTLEVRL